MRYFKHKKRNKTKFFCLIDAFGENYWYSNSTIILRDISLFDQIAPIMAPEHFNHSSAPSIFQSTPFVHILINNFIILSNWNYYFQEALGLPFACDWLNVHQGHQMHVSHVRFWGLECWGAKICGFPYTFSSVPLVASWLSCPPPVAPWPVSKSSITETIPSTSHCFI